MRFRSIFTSVLVAVMWLATATPVFAAGFRDVLDTPASLSPLAAHSLLNGLAKAGDRIVAIGQRGHIVYSDDAGSTWKQAKVPVSSDLLAVSFPTPKLGWVVGHDGVILHSADAGLTWTLQLDGRRIGDMMRTYYTALAGKGELGTPADTQRMLDDIARVADQGPENSLLDVWFADERNGFAVGTFNLIFRTEDGGKTWVPWYHATDNPKRLHFYAVRGIGADVYLAGEQGLLLKLAPDDNRFRNLTTPYKGTFFGIVGNATALVAFGLRGNAFRSTDGGANWFKVETPFQDGITAGTPLNGDTLLLASQSGQLLLGQHMGESFVAAKLEHMVPAAAVIGIGNDVVLVAGPRGIQRHSLR
ncbi:Glycosyl hydrolase [Georgfuchsia toluolica]|uniref:Glycosyl hydrolase n=1 Tax=Georgfuchsia toluolica TaxID=424218 RepID=A0A916N9A5_9PROT|nr:YCF48-related protein [Georgfuchsia toluolica]CAG4883660.1 Glycosyl hydrolase [Georgfuchsia toluolica]